MKREFILQVSGWRAPVTLGYTAPANRSGMILAFACGRMTPNLKPGDLPPPPTMAQVACGRVLELPEDACDLVSPDLTRAVDARDDGRFRGRGWRATVTAFQPVLYRSQYLAGIGGRPDLFDSPGYAMVGGPHPFGSAALSGDYVWHHDIDGPTAVPLLGSIAVQISDGGLHPHEITMLIREEGAEADAARQNIPVEFKGLRLIWMKDDDDTPNGPLAYPEHLGENGHIRPSALFADSYAHMFDGVIKRYNMVIGTIDDLVFL